MNYKDQTPALRLILLLICFITPFALLAVDTHFYGYNRLSCSLIKTMCQDYDGFVWIGTEYGLNRFDGYRFEQYYNDEKDSTSLASNDVRCLYNDRGNRLWIGTSRTLQWYDACSNSFRTVPFEGIGNTGVSQLLRLHDGRFFAITTGRGIFELDENQSVLRKHILKRFEGQRVVRMYEDRSYRVWISTSAGQVYCFSSDNLNGNPLFVVPVPQLRQVKRFGEDKKGRIYMCTDMQVYHFDEVRHQLQAMISGDGFSLYDIRDLCTTTEGDLLVLQYSGIINRINGMDGLMHQDSSLALPFTLRNASCTALMEDRNQNIWVGMMRHGIMMFLHSKPMLGFADFISPQMPQGIGTVCAITCGDDSSIYLGALSGNVYRCNIQGDIIADYKFQSAVYSLYSKGNLLYVGTYADGLAIVHIGTGQISYVSSLSGERISSITSDSQGCIYVAVFGKGVMALGSDSSKLIPIASKQNGKSPLKDSHVNVLMVDSRQRLWAGHYKGIDVYDIRKQKFVPQKELELLSGMMCSSLLEDQLGNIWIGTAKGLYCWEPAKQKLTGYTTAHGLSSNMICGIEEDAEGNIWCSTYNGICMLRRSDGQINHYYDGSQSAEKEFSRGACGISPDASEIYFGGVKGATWFAPASLHNQRKLLPVMLTGVIAAGKRLSFSSFSGEHELLKSMTDVTHIYLSEEERTFTLEFSTFDFSNAESTSYEFRLADNGDTWTTLATGTNSITFSNLPYGTSAIQVRAFQGGQYTPIKQMVVHIDAPWYLSWPAFLFYLVIISTLAFLLYINVRHQRSISENEKRTRLFINIAHDIRSPMTLVVSPLEMLLQKDFDSKTMHLLRTMYRNSQRIISMMNELLEIRRIERGQLELHCESTNMEDFAKSITEIFVELAARHNIQLSVVADGEVYASVDRKQLDKVFVNLIDNAFKYTPDGGKITIRIGITNRKLGRWSIKTHPFALVEVEDTGKGIDPNEARHLFNRFYQGEDNGGVSSGFGIGLNLCKLIIEKHHGMITARRVSAAGGSVFSLLLPLAASDDVKGGVTAGEGVSTRYPFLLGEPTEEEGGNVSKHGKRAHILIIDDDDEIRDFLSTELGERYRISCCRNAEDALHTAVSQLPDLIISDIIMPGMDGITLLKRLKANTSVCHIPVIMLTTKSDRTDRLKGLEMGVDAYLAKPFILDELQTLIANLLNSRMLLRGKFSGIQEQVDRMETIQMKGNDEQLMERIMKSVNRHLADSNFTVEILASEVGLSRVQLHRRMKDMTGIAASDFIRNLRIKQAARLLSEHKINVAQVAYAVGFVNRTHFSTVFKKYYGMTPQEYAEQHNKRQDVTDANVSDT